MQLGRSTAHTVVQRKAGEELMRAQRQPFELSLQICGMVYFFSSASSFAG
jgi:hypothetical protein